MAHVSQLPCDGDGVCMICNHRPSGEENLVCNLCATPWHLNCLSSRRPETLLGSIDWQCPDCFPGTTDGPKPPPEHGVAAASGGLVAAIRAIESDVSLSEREKAKRRQELLSGGARSAGGGDGDLEKEKINGCDNVLNLLDGNLNCSVCMQLLDRPVTTPCGHNFCLKCFQKWIGQGKRTCANCRHGIPAKMASQPRINSALVVAIRMAKMPKSVAAGGSSRVYHSVQNQNRPDKAYTTERAKKAGKANACSGKIFVTIPPDHFGPILAENDPDRKQGVLVGESWEDRMECRQWGAHFPHVAGIGGQSKHGAQSVALSGGYQDDEDHGEWFLYTGSGGRDLSGNKRTSKAQSFDQKFEKSNEALRMSCRKGYPVRVVRSHKEKRSSYAPEAGVRYDGVYRIEKCWRKVGIQGYKVCRYLFVRCDNDPAPWTSDDRGDSVRPLPVIEELKNATDITERKGSPAWDYDEEKCCWMWKKPPPESRKQMDNEVPEEGKRKRKRQSKNMSIRERLLKEFSCCICREVMTLPLTTPCAHNFCKACLEGAFAGQSFTRQRTCEGRRTLRVQKNVMKCPSCPNDISDFLQNPQVNRELMGVIESLQSKTDDMEENDECDEEIDGTQEKADASELVEVCNEDKQDIEDEKASTLNPKNETNPKKTRQQKNLSVEVGEATSEMSDKGLQATAGESKNRQTRRGKKAVGASDAAQVMTRSKRGRVSTTK